MKPAPTARQAQFLAYIYHYDLLNGCAPAEADMQRFFQISPPSVHSMVLTLERRGFISRVPGQARSITLLLPSESLPPCNASTTNLLALRRLLWAQEGNRKMTISWRFLPFGSIGFSSKQGLEMADQMAPGYPQ